MPLAANKEEQANQEKEASSPIKKPAKENPFGAAKPIDEEEVRKKKEVETVDIWLSY